MAEAAHGQHIDGAISDGRSCFAGARAGIIPTSVFANGTAGASYVSADGEW